MRHYPLSLDDLILARGALRESAARRILASVLRALLYLHDADIVHRDVNAGNILLAASKAPYGAVLCDFGLANFVDRRGARVRIEEERRRRRHAGEALEDGHDVAGMDGCTFTSAVGAPAYIAPEVVERDRYGAPVDAWGVGVMMYYILSARLPFGDGDGGADAVAVLDAVRDARVEFGDGWETISREAKSLIGGLLVADQRKRLSVEAAMAHPWFAMVDEREDQREGTVWGIRLDENVRSGGTRGKGRGEEGEVVPRAEKERLRRVQSGGI